MPPLHDKRWLSYAALILAGFAACEYGRAALVRRERMRRGELRRLRSVWRRVRGLSVHALACTEVAPPAVPPVVLVHGFGIASSYWVPAAERLAARFEVYAPDLPGHGRSEAPEHTYDIAEQADVLAEWMDAMHIERAALVSHSMGCQIALQAALRDPARIARLVLIGPTLEPAARDLAPLFARVVRSALHERLTLAFQILRDYVRAGPRLPQEFAFMLRYPIERKLAQLAMPVLLIRGEHDAIAPRAWLEHAAELIGDRVQVLEVPGTGHAANYSAPDALVERIAPFLTALRSDDELLLSCSRERGE